MREARVEARWKDTRYAAVYVVESSGGSLEPKSGDDVRRLSLRFQVVGAERKKRTQRQEGVQWLGSRVAFLATSSLLLGKLVLIRNSAAEGLTRGQVLTLGDGEVVSTHSTESTHCNILPSDWTVGHSRIKKHGNRLADASGNIVSGINVASRRVGLGGNCHVVAPVGHHASSNMRL